MLGHSDRGGAGRSCNTILAGPREIRPVGRGLLRGITARCRSASRSGSPGAPQIGVGDFGERDQLDGVHLDQVPPQPYPRLQIGRDLPRRDPDGQRPARRSSAGCQPVLGASGSRPACRHPRGSAGAPAGTSCRHLRAGRATRCRAVGGAVTGAGLVLDAGPRLGDRVRHGRVHVLSGPFAAGLLRWPPRLPRGC
jgi:hypothetical protein